MKTIINNTKGVVSYEEGNNIVLETTGEIQIKGDVTIAGSTTTNARIDDRIIELAYGTTGSRSSGLEDAGIIIERGDDDNVFFGWDLAHFPLYSSLYCPGNASKTQTAEPSTRLIVYVSKLGANPRLEPIFLSGSIRAGT